MLNLHLWDASNAGNLDRVKHLIEIEGMNVDSKNIGVITQSTILFLLFLIYFYF